ncbi:S9 family peptidase [Aliiglaciecola sp. CAU 1673]|uniref:S9 family peptidase n=1 Tax=Aliiglaciecola sp. CAU 1673 TaxID=3032595 RepID=UPI0023DC09F8|nr:S9 family peptidase [Aliiglaciecola sp. CAU 1673]MDF2177706.1 S9 family peptidase [Aliiglaciecola sp. CAU 1673]
MKLLKSFAIALSLISAFVKAETDQQRLSAVDLFQLEYAADLEISPNGDRVYFVRHFMDIQSDKKLGNIWFVDLDGKMRPLTSGKHSDRGLALSPDGQKLAYTSNASGSSQIHMMWLDNGQQAKLTNLQEAPAQLSWSPDGRFLAFSQFVPEETKAPVSLKGKPSDAKWAEPAVFIDDLYYRQDGAGYNKPGHQQIFVLSTDGGTPRQLTFDAFDHGGPLSWGADGQHLYFSANRHADHEMVPLNTELYRLAIDSGEIQALTDRNGPDQSPHVSPDGKWLAYLGFDDKGTNYENQRLYLMPTEGGKNKVLTSDLDRSINQIQWDAKSKGLYFSFDDMGKTKLAYQSLNGNRQILTDTLGGQSLGRPYASGEFAVSKGDAVAFSYSVPSRPADVALVKSGKTKVLTHLNEDALGHKTLARVEEIWFKSSADNLDIQGWVAYPPDFDPAKQYPLILEIHGGPVANYGPHFASEIQLYAAAGYVVLYVNPRGSDSYGEDFAQKIHLNYPSQDYDDLMSGVDALIKKGNIDPKRLYVTGGSGGGVLTAWIVGHTDRFKAAVVAKPVINWFSFVLTADYYPFFTQYWFGKKPWEDMQGYMQRSPISYVGNVKTPTMLLTGEADYRTPISETEQFYQALKLQGVETAMVRIPGASHGIYMRPSNLMSKVEYILWWFSQYQPAQEP